MKKCNYLLTVYLSSFQIYFPMENLQAIAHKVIEHYKEPKELICNKQHIKIGDYYYQLRLDSAGIPVSLEYVVPEKYPYQHTKKKAEFDFLVQNEKEQVAKYPLKFKEYLFKKIQIKSKLLKYDRQLKLWANDPTVLRDLELLCENNEIWQRLLINLCQQGQLNRAQFILLYQMNYSENRAARLIVNLRSKNESIFNHFRRALQNIINTGTDALITRKITTFIPHFHTHQYEEPKCKEADVLSSPNPVFVLLSFHLRNLWILFHNEPLSHFIVTQSHCMGLLNNNEIQTIFHGITKEEQTRKFWLLIESEDAHGINALLTIFSMLSNENMSKILLINDNERELARNMVTNFLKRTKYSLGIIRSAGKFTDAHKWLDNAFIEFYQLIAGENVSPDLIHLFISLFARIGFFNKSAVNGLNSDYIYCKMNYRLISQLKRNLVEFTFPTDHMALVITTLSQLPQLTDTDRGFINQLWNKLDATKDGQITFDAQSPKLTHRLNVSWMPNDHFSWLHSAFQEITQTSENYNVYCILCRKLLEQTMLSRDQFSKLISAENSMVVRRQLLINLVSDQHGNPARFINALENLRNDAVFYGLDSDETKKCGDLLNRLRQTSGCLNFDPPLFQGFEYGQRPVFLAGL